ncbi:MAG: phage antirepressor KilAC domain-containing protein [Coprobacillus sp.]
MCNIQVFNFHQNDVRTIEQNNEIWFCLKDVCDILQLGNPSQVKTTLKQEGLTTNEVGVQTGLKGDGTPAIQNVKMNFINESNLYKVIFQSRKEEAEEFTEYVTGTILPSIRKHGAYMNDQTLEQALTNPDFLIRLATELKEEQQKRKELEVQNSQLTVDNQIMVPKAEYFDELVDRHLLTNIRETAKELKVKEKEFVQFLLDKKYLYRDKRGKLVPYAEKNKNLFEIKECFNEQTNWKGIQTLVTPKGRETFRLLLQGQ